jgi:hypothetical protein
MNNQNQEFAVQNPEARYYQIRLKGYLNPDWSEWFDGLSIRHEEGVTLLTGLVKDQSALFGIFLKIQNLGLTLLSVIPICQKTK